MNTTHETKKVFLGSFGKTKGLRGEIWFYPYNLETETLVADQVLYLEDTPQRSFKIKTASAKPKGYLITFEGIHTIEDVQGLVGQRAFVYRTQLPTPKDAEYYHIDLIGCDVQDESGQYIGKVTQVLSTKANDVFVVRATEGAHQEHLIPFVDDYVFSVDTQQKVIRAVVPEVV